MFHSETIARVIHADRMRDLERAARNRRLLSDPLEESAWPAPSIATRVVPPVARRPCGDSARLPA
jgi:hypothetical protein